MRPVSTLGLTYQALVMLVSVVPFASFATLVNGEEAQKGQGRKTPIPGSDDLEGWKTVQAATKTELRVIAADYTLARHSKWQETTDELISVFKALASQRLPHSKCATSVWRCPRRLCCGLPRQIFPRPVTLHL